MLSDRDIRQQFVIGRLRIEPFDEDLVQPASYDVRLGGVFRVFDNHKYDCIDPRQDQPQLTRMVTPARGEPFILHPGEFVLGSTLETVTLHRTLAARLEGKSSLGRLGLLTHATAGWIDPGFHGQVTLELSSVATLPIKLWPGMRVGQLCVFQLSSPADGPYQGRYQGQYGPVPSRSHLDSGHAQH